MMNNKGQTLVMFILLLPIIFIFTLVCIDIGNNLILKKKNENALQDVILYALKDKEYDEDILKKNLEKNLEYESLSISKTGNILEVEITSEFKGTFDKIFNLGFNKITINIKYDLENKRIIRE